MTAEGVLPRRSRFLAPSVYNTSTHFQIFAFRHGAIPLDLYDSMRRIAFPRIPYRILVSFCIVVYALFWLSGITVAFITGLLDIEVMGNPR